ncbi:MAG: 50S ribosomal protein L11 methyltransferase [Deltaproteobacteria bacterium]|jgi:ribosomal protein L11 methyltransferase|nr:50S ribosomal protein L11 methyltransferase [Deltaproteobacteria bacterium]
MEDWLLATVALPPIAAEAVSDALFELGAGGVWEDQPDANGRVVLKSGFPQNSELHLMAELPGALSYISNFFGISLDGFSLVLELKPGEDYSESWKKDLTPIEITPALIIAPSWWSETIECSSEAAILRLDPGSAFGSGHHPTTFLCLRLLCRLIDQNLRLASILDLGAGSGVLALSAALLLPTAAIKALDNDPDTIFAARTNLTQNGLSGRFDMEVGSIEEAEGEFDLIMANLTRNVLISLAKNMAAKSRLPGRLIVSGILDDQASDVAKAFETLGFYVDCHLGREQWSALSLVRGLPAPADPSLIERQIIPTQAQQEETLIISESSQPAEEPDD